MAQSILKNSSCQQLNLVELGQMSHFFFNLVKTAIFFMNFKSWLYHEHDRAAGKMGLVMSFQAIASVAQVALQLFSAWDKAH